MEIGTHVRWRKILGKPDASMSEKEGFGTLESIEEGRGLRIIGDYGLFSSMVQKVILSVDGIIYVVTWNSLYEITRLN